MHIHYYNFVSFVFKHRIKWANVSQNSVAFCGFWSNSEDVNDSQTGFLSRNELERIQSDSDAFAQPLKYW